MLFQRINRSDAETVFAIFYNVAGATITAGYPAMLDVGTFDGIRVTKPVTGSFNLMVGLAAASIADSAYGKFQLYGYNSQAYVSNTTNTAITAGYALMPVTAQWYLTANAGADLTTTIPFIVAGEAYATATAGAVAATAKKVFIRAL